MSDYRRVINTEQTHAQNPRDASARCDVIELLSVLPLSSTVKEPELWKWLTWLMQSQTSDTSSQRRANTKSVCGWLQGIAVLFLIFITRSIFGLNLCHVRDDADCDQCFWVRLTTGMEDYRREYKTDTDTVHAQNSSYVYTVIYFLFLSLYTCKSFTCFFIYIISR